MIGAIILGILAGFIGKALMPGKDPGGFFATILIGLAGAVIGYLIFNRLLGIGDDDVFDLGGLLGAIIGVVILLFAYRKFAESRAEPAAAKAAASPRRGPPAERAGSGLAARARGSSRGRRRSWAPRGPGPGPVSPAPLRRIPAGA